jgi:hypothetical protein|tara:strand:- start:3013 stop:3243 length:231 start_codon:yes stop_codon:yes gene_type:complete
MREFLATLTALVIILSTIWVCFFGLSIVANFSESVGVSKPLVYFLSGLGIGIYREKIWRGFASFCENVWDKILRLI